MCFKTPTPPTVTPPAPVVQAPAAPAPTAPVLPDDSVAATRNAGNARKRLRIDLGSSTPTSGAGLVIPQ